LCRNDRGHTCVSERRRERLSSRFARYRKRRIFALPFTLRVPDQKHMASRTEIWRAARARDGDAAKKTHSEEKCQQ
jgi:hypothetical protein